MEGNWKMIAVPTGIGSWHEEELENRSWRGGAGQEEDEEDKSPVKNVLRSYGVSHNLGEANLFTQCL